MTSLLLLIFATYVATQAIPTNFTIRYTNTWNDPSHPSPASGMAPHFSPSLIVFHTESSRIWGEGLLATPGLSELSRFGNPSNYSVEVAELQQSGEVGSFFVYEELLEIDDTFEMTFLVDPQFPQVSICFMLAETPDWFAGVDTYDLLNEDGEWRNSGQMDLFVYDAGVDDGTQLRFLPDFPTVPQQPIRKNAVFADLPPVGSFEFRNENGASLLSLSIMLIGSMMMLIF